MGAVCWALGNGLRCSSIETRIARWRAASSKPSRSRVLFLERSGRKGAGTVVRINGERPIMLRAGESRPLGCLR
eukprot:scaffold75351_cov31-Tisochrysis_lutea.AAC.5